MVVEVAEGESVGVPLGVAVGMAGEYVDVIVDVASVSEESGVLEGRTCVGVWLGMLGLEVGLEGMVVAVSFTLNASA